MLLITDKKSASGWINGFTGMCIFSGSLPATKMAIADFSPFFLTFSRATIAGLLGLAMILAMKQKVPSFRQTGALLVVALGVVLGFPLLTALALEHVSSAHSLVFLGLLPLSTALFGVLRGGEKPGIPFWLCSGAGSLLVVAFALSQASNTSLTGDLLMLAAVVVCGLGYAEGAKLTRELGGWQVISWALIISLPVMFSALLFTFPASLSSVSVTGWLGLGYVSLFSMLIGFIFWYKGLAAGGIAAVGQLQLLQPFIGLGLSATLLHEKVSTLMILVTLGVVICVSGSKKFAYK
ncbi:TPA: DMT family transporter [Klebsiella pneumoniae]|nr:DMT family transporter [Klebsiella pneumoniae]HBV9252975.1 DMT family transporter [Klebsiella pneumoniae]